MGQYTGKTYSQEEYSNLNAATGKPFGQASDEIVDSQIKNWQDQGTNVVGAKQPEDIRSLGGQLVDWAQTPNGIAVLSGLGIAGAAGLGLNARKNRQAEPTARVEPYNAPPYDFETTAREVPERKSLPQPSTPAPQTSAQAPSPTMPSAAANVMPQGPAAPPVESAPNAVPPLTDKQRREKAMADLAEHRLEEARKASAAKEAQQAEGKKQTTTASGGVKPEDRQMLNSSENAKIDKAVIADQKAVVPKPTPITPEIPDAITPPAETPTQAKKPAKSKAIPTYKTATDIPEGMVFRSDVGNLDRSLVNILGTEGRLYAKDVLNEGKMFGEHKGADYNKKVSDLVSAYGEELKKITPSIDLTTRDGRVAAGVPHTQNYGPALGKAAKVGGVLGTLMTVAQSANAKEALSNVAESLLPIGATPSELQSGKLTEKQLKAFEEAKKLGSPYRSVPPPKK